MTDRQEWNWHRNDDRRDEERNSRRDGSAYGSYGDSWPRTEGRRFEEDTRWGRDDRASYAQRGYRQDDDWRGESRGRSFDGRGYDDRRGSYFEQRPYGRPHDPSYGSSYERPYERFQGARYGRPYEHAYGSNFRSDRDDRYAPSWQGGSLSQGRMTMPREGRAMDDDRPYREFSGSYSGSHAGKGPKGFKRDGSRIRDNVCECLMDDDQLDASSIQVRCDEDEVVLEGTVESRSMKRRAEDLAHGVRGVHDVQNRITVRKANRSDDNDKKTSRTNTSPQTAEAK